MTTIAFDGKTLAGDTQTSMYRGAATKVHRLTDGRLYGACGQLQDAIAVLEWLEGYGEKPKVEDGFHAILIKDGECFTLENKLVKVGHGRKIFAVGSGRDFAMAAMHLGKSAREAVLVAHQFDVDTGDEVVDLAVCE